MDVEHRTARLDHGIVQKHCISLHHINYIFHSIILMKCLFYKNLFLFSNVLFLHFFIDLASILKSYIFFFTNEEKVVGSEGRRNVSGDKGLPKTRQPA